MHDPEPSSSPARTDRELPAPIRAMAEALKANAEALHKLDTNQKKLVDTLEKTDRSQQVVASTRALNETFKGLGEIQRGLLDAVVKDRGRGRGLPFAFAAIAVLAGLLGFLLYERWRHDDAVPKAVYEAARASADERAAETARLRETVDAREGDTEALRLRLHDAQAAQDAAARERDAATARIRELEAEVEAKEARLENYLTVKEQAELAGTYFAQNQRLQAGLADARRRLSLAEGERQRLLDLIAEQKLDGLEGDPAAIKARAKELGVFEEPEKMPPPSDGPVPLGARDARQLKLQLNRLLGRAPGDEIYEILEVGAVGKGGVLLAVKAGQYQNQQLLNSLTSKELEIRVDPARDLVELRFRDGGLASARTPGGPIPFREGGHSVFLKDVGFRAWLEEVGTGFLVAADGRLTWKSAPS